MNHPATQAKPFLYGGIRPDPNDPYFVRHYNAIATEGLTSRTMIAAELAWRDRLIDDRDYRLASRDPNKKIVYLSGPMTGIPEFNFPLFHAEAARLRGLGYKVINPAELNPDTTATHAECMRTDIRALTYAGTIAVLPGWEQSQGATLEVAVGKALGMVIVAASLLQW